MGWPIVVIIETATSRTLISVMSLQPIEIPVTHSCNLITTHLLSIERVDWLKLHDMFNARDTKSKQWYFPVEFPVGVYALNSFFINIFYGVVARIESRCVIKSITCIVGLLIPSILRWKTALAVKRSCNFSREKSNELTGQQDRFHYTHNWVVGTWRNVGVRVK